MNNVVHEQEQVQGFDKNKVYKQFMVIIGVFLACFISSEVLAGTTGSDFKEFYDWIYGAATGYLGRGIALVGGVIGLGYGAASGKALPAIVGIVLAIFGALGPKIIDTIFKSAIII